MKSKESMKTKDIYFVAWLEATKSIVFDKYDIIDNRNKIAEFTFEIDPEIFKTYKIEYLRSESVKTRYAFRRLKDIIN